MAQFFYTDIIINITLLDPWVTSVTSDYRIEVT
jgi:hypothetical protein